MKRKLSELFYFFLSLVVKARLAFYKQMNSGKERLFIYTDSRGFDVTKITHKYNAFSWYTKYFVKNFHTDTFVCPERSTTVYDFLDQYQRSTKDYKFVIAHIGVVDFAPRPISQNRMILASKKDKIVRLFGQEVYDKLLAFEGYPEKFNGEITASTVPEFMLKAMAEKFNEIDNLIWISCSPIDINWVGNYKKRPDNCGMIQTKSKEFLKLLTTESVIDLTSLSSEEIREITCDNVHLTKKGSNFILQKLRTIVENS